MNPPASWAWLMALFTAAGLIEGVALSHMTSFIPLYLPQLGVLEERVPEVTGRIVAISSAIGLPFVPLWGALADRYARQPIIVRSFIFHTLALVIMLLAGNVWIFMAGRSLMSFSLGNTGLMLTTLTERAPRGRIGFIFTIVNGAIPIGALIGPLAGGPIVDAWGFRTLLLIDVSLMVVVVLAMSFGYRDTFVATQRKPILRMVADSLFIILDSPRLRTLFPSLFLLFAGYMLAITYTPIAINTLYTGSNAATAVGIVMGVSGFATLLISPPLGILADKIGHWRVLFACVALMIVLLPLPALAFSPSTSSGHGVASFAVIWAAISSLGASIVALAFGRLADSASDATRGRVMSLSTLPLMVGFMLGAAIGSVVTAGGVFMAFPVAALIAALGAAGLVLASRQPAAQTAQAA